MSNRPALLKGTTHRMMVGCGKIYITVNKDPDNQPFEVFAKIGKSGGCVSCQMEALGRMTTLAMKAKVDINIIAHQLDEISCPSPIWSEGVQVLSCADAIALALRKEFNIPRPKKEK